MLVIMATNDIKYIVIYVAGYTQHNEIVSPTVRQQECHSVITAGLIVRAICLKPRKSEQQQLPWIDVCV